MAPRTPRLPEAQGIQRCPSMSSTKRGATREASDYYVTPQWAILDFLSAFVTDNPAIIFEPLTILDPCAGGDSARPMAYPQALATFGRLDIERLITLDIRDDSPASQKGDYLQTVLSATPNLIITNPPFGLTIPIIEKALADVSGGGWVIMLQRLNFFGGQHEKREFFDRVGPPSFCYVHRRRCGFMPAGSINPASGKPYTQDSIEYAHFVWVEGARPQWTRLRII